MVKSLISKGLTVPHRCEKRYKTEKQFASWLGLCPGCRITGGKVKSSQTRKVVNRVDTELVEVPPRLSD
jgi:hypothetical protein